MGLGKIGVLMAFLSAAVLWGMASEPAPAPIPIPVTGGTDTPVVYPSNPTATPDQATLHLLVVQALSLSSPLDTAGTPIQASFVVRNVGKTPLSIDQITVGIYDGLTWKAIPAANFPPTANLVIQPGEEYAFQATQTFSVTGEYFAQPVILSGGRWKIIDGATREWFEVD